MQLEAANTKVGGASARRRTANSRLWYCYMWRNRSAFTESDTRTDADTHLRVWAVLVLDSRLHKLLPRIPFSLIHTSVCNLLQVGFPEASCSSSTWSSHPEAKSFKMESVCAGGSSSLPSQSRLKVFMALTHIWNSLSSASSTTPTPLSPLQSVRLLLLLCFCFYFFIKPMFSSEDDGVCWDLRDTCTLPHVHTFTPQPWTEEPFLVLHPSPEFLKQFKFWYKSKFWGRWTDGSSALWLRSRRSFIPVFCFRAWEDLRPRRTFDLLLRIFLNMDSARSEA